ncbi:MAG: hypothetical protein KKD48_01545 [Nanoarchaeota archaeon]|nr:hypothetical protein [Nanoarchaeota archaeon]
MVEKCERCGKEVNTGEIKTYCKEELCNDCYNKEKEKNTKKLRAHRIVSLSIDNLKKVIGIEGKKRKLSDKQIEEAKIKAQNLKTWQIMSVIIFVIVILFIKLNDIKTIQLRGLIEVFFSLLALIILIYAYIKKKRFISYLRKLEIFDI